MQKYDFYLIHAKKRITRSESHIIQQAILHIQRPRNPLYPNLLARAKESGEAKPLSPKILQQATS